jgi:DNA-binding transcriptional MerR regulator
MDGLKIGDVASAAGVSRDTIRYYERLRLLPRPGRTRSGYRLYSQSDIEQVRFIKQAQSLGLSLDEIKQLLPGRGAGLEECRRVRDLLKAKLEELDSRLSELRAFRRKLATYLGECEQALADREADCCPVLFEISRPDRVETETRRKKKEALKRIKK